MNSAKFTRPGFTLLVGLALLGGGIWDLAGEWRARSSGIPVPGQFTGAYESRNILGPEFDTGMSHYPTVRISPPGGGSEVLVLADQMDLGAFTADTEGTFLYVPGDTPELRLPARVSRLGGPVIWACLGIGAMMVFAGAIELRRTRVA